MDSPLYNIDDNNSEKHFQLKKKKTGSFIAERGWSKFPLLFTQHYSPEGII